MNRAGFVMLVVVALGTSVLAAGMDNCPGTVVTVPFCDCDSTLGAGLDHDCGAGHAGADVVYQITDLTIGNLYQIIGEATYDADWTVATTCAATIGDLKCADAVDPHTDPSCSSLVHVNRGYLTMNWIATQNTVWVWVDSFDASSSGNYCLEVLDLGVPTPVPTPISQGDNCLDPIVIAMEGWTPGNGTFTTSGTTCGYTNDYTETNYGCGNGLTSNEAVYSFTPPSTLVLQIDLIGSAYDTKLVITDKCPNSRITCKYNDDYWEDQSGFACLEFTGGINYFIFIEGHDGACGEYILNIDACSPPTPTPEPTGCPSVVCPPGAVPEGEPDCGPDYEDSYNGGCTSSPYVFQDIHCGDVICATSGTYLYGTENYRDTDWYRLELMSYTELTWEIEAEFSSQIFIFDARTEDCIVYFTIDSSTMPCGINSLTAVLAPGVYWLWAGPNGVTGFDCPLTYVASLTCNAVPTPTPSPSPTPRPSPVGPGDDCSDPFHIDMTGWNPYSAYTYTDSGDTCGFGAQYDMPDYTCGESLTSNEVVYQFTPPQSMAITIDLLGSDFNTKLVVTDGCPAAFMMCKYNDDYAGTVQSGLSCLHVSVGSTYFIFIEGLSNACGAYTLNLEVCPEPTPTPTPTAVPPTLTPLPTHTPSPIAPTVTPIPTDTPSPVQSTPTPECINDGDVNLDNTISSEDAQLAFAIAVGAMQPSQVQFCAADCDGNGYISAGDAQTIFYSIFGLLSCVDPIAKQPLDYGTASSQLLTGSSGD